MPTILLALSSHETFERVSLTKYRGRVEIEIQSRGAMTPSFLVVAIFPVVLCILVPCRVLEPCFAPKFPAFSRVNCFLFYFSALFFFLVQSRTLASASRLSSKTDNLLNFQPLLAAVFLHHPRLITPSMKDFACLLTRLKVEFAFLRLLDLGRVLCHDCLHFSIPFISIWDNCVVDIENFLEKMYYYYYY